MGDNISKALLAAGVFILMLGIVIGFLSGAFAYRLFIG